MRAMNEPRICTSGARANERVLRYRAVMLLCVVLVIIVACGPPHRRRGPGPGSGRGIHVPPPDAAALVILMKDRLKLTPSQEEAVLPIMEEHCKKRDLIMQRYTEAGPNAYGYYKGATRTLQQETETHLATVLTEKQMAEYREMEEERQKMKEKGMGGMGRPPGGGMEGGMDSSPFR